MLGWGKNSHKENSTYLQLSGSSLTSGAVVVPVEYDQSEGRDIGFFGSGGLQIHSSNDAIDEVSLSECESTQFAVVVYFKS